MPQPTVGASSYQRLCAFLYASALSCHAEQCDTVPDQAQQSCRHFPSLGGSPAPGRHGHGGPWMEHDTAATRVFFSFSIFLLLLPAHLLAAEKKGAQRHAVLTSKVARKERASPRPIELYEAEARTDMMLSAQPHRFHSITLQTPHACSEPCGRRPSGSRHPSGPPACLLGFCQCPIGEVWR